MGATRVAPLSLKEKLLRLPLRLFRPGMVVPVLSGPLRGKRWIVGASAHACWLGTYESGPATRFARAVGPGSIVFDLGAGAGFYSLLASALAGGEGRVYAFEPLPRNLHYLQRHLRLNRCHNVTVIEAAVSYKNGLAPLEADPGGMKARLAADGALQARTCALDAWVATGQVPAPDLVRMDIGGGEFAALTGARELFSKRRPALFLSTHDATQHQKCCAFLDLLGYRLEPLDGKALESAREILARP